MFCVYLGPAHAIVLLALFAQETLHSSRMFTPSFLPIDSHKSKQILQFWSWAALPERKGKTTQAEETLSSSIKEQETHWLRGAVRPHHHKAAKQKVLMRIWRVTGSTRLRTWLPYPHAAVGYVMWQLFHVYACIDLHAAAVPSPTVAQAYVCLSFDSLLVQPKVEQGISRGPVNVRKNKHSTLTEVVDWLILQDTLNFMIVPQI
eukprot:1140858-Pelagomonas_calceolata.AAC.4